MAAVFVRVRSLGSFASDAKERTRTGCLLCVPVRSSHVPGSFTAITPVIVLKRVQFLQERMPRSLAFAQTRTDANARERAVHLLVPRVRSQNSRTNTWLFNDFANKHIVHSSFYS